MKRINVGIIGTGWCGGIRANTCANNALVDELHIAEIKPDRLDEIAKPVGGDPQSAVTAVENVEAEFAFQLGDQAADRRLGQTQQIRRLGRGPAGDYGPKGFELPKLHVAIPWFDLA